LYAQIKSKIKNQNSYLPKKIITKNQGFGQKTQCACELYISITRTYYSEMYFDIFQKCPETIPEAMSKIKKILKEI